MHYLRRGRAVPALVATLFLPALFLPGLALPALAQGDTSSAPAEETLPRVEISVTVQGQDGKPTLLGSFVIEVFPGDAPKHADNFLRLAREGFYEGTTFHRIVPGFIIQGGDPISKTDCMSSRLGTGGPAATIQAEITRKHVRGAVAAARKPDAVNPDRASNGSQFYICLADLPSLDRGEYTVFGRVVKGMDVVDKIALVKNSGKEGQQRALQCVEMTKVRVLP